MTRKQALELALNLIEEVNIEEKAEIIKILQNIKDEMPVYKWTKASSIDAVCQWTLENGAAPSISNFREKSLPSHTVLKNLFNMTAKEFLNTYFNEDKLLKLNIKNNKTDIDFFKSEFLKIKPSSAKMYNANRGKNTPTWQFFAKKTKTHKWNDLLKHCGFETKILKSKYQKRVSKKTVFFVKRTVDAEKVLELL